MTRVTVVNRHLSIADVCPTCGSGIRIAAAKTEQGDRVYRLECLACGWMTDALPDPEAD